MKDYRGFDISEYDEFSSNQLRSMMDNKQLDMLLENPNTKKKVYIKYHLDTKIKAGHIYEYIEDLFEIENTLSNDDELIIVTKDNLNEATMNLLEQIYLNDKKFVNIYNINRFLFNILEHHMVPKHTILSEEGKQKIIEKYYITDDSKFPEISRFDPAATCMGVRPGELVEIERPSPTAITSLYYRLCI
tara:strand:+ start:473 stop:1039 length:567 start_codon:yes stop_codon:yes gene_type:complete